MFRVGQLSGDIKTGVWNMKEAWPLLLSSVKLTGSLPNLIDEKLDWLPVDVAASAMIEGALMKTSEDRDVLGVYHLLNDAASTTWTDLIGWARKRLDFETVLPEEWIGRLEHAAEAGSNHPALQLLDHWKATYADSKATERKGAKPEVATAVSRGALPSMRNIKAIDESYFEKLWSWIASNM